MYLPQSLKPVVRLVERKAIASVIIFLNLVGFIWGLVFWYGKHLLEGKPGMAPPSPLLWPFIPDCPLFAGLFILAFLAVRRYGSRLPRGWRLYATLTAAGLIKYGIWTDVFWLANWGGGGLIDPLGVLMFATHVGMILEGIYLVGYLAPRRLDAAVSLAWFLASDYVDYGLGQYPLFFDYQVPFWLMKWHTIAMTFLLHGWLWVLAGRRASRFVDRPFSSPVSLSETSGAGEARTKRMEV